jgi:hypothetical protein
MSVRLMVKWTFHKLLAPALCIVKSVCRRVVTVELNSVFFFFACLQDHTEPHLRRQQMLQMTVLTVLILSFRRA